MHDAQYQNDPNVSPIAPGRYDGKRFDQAVPMNLVVGNRQQLKQQILDALMFGASPIVLDLAATVYVDASGCGVLVSISKKCREAGAELVLEHLTDDVRTIFEITKLDTLFATVIR